MLVFDLDVVVAIAEEQDVSLYEAEDQLRRLFAKNEEEEEVSVA